MNRFLIFIVLLLSFAIHANTDENKPQWETGFILNKTFLKLVR